MPNATKNNKTRNRKEKVTEQRQEKSSMREISAPASVTSTSFPIVAIGASAGGLEAFSSLLRALPPEPGLALVFIPHLDPTHESAMVELLSRITRLPVLQAKEGLKVECNSVYVLPPNSEMTIADGVLHLAKREPGRGHHMPIDTFFRSLAD